MLLVTGSLAGVALLLWLTREREPSYQGKPLTFWVKAYEQEVPAENAGFPPGQGAKAIRNLGTNALPCLLKWVSFEPSKSNFRYQVGKVFSRLPFFSQSEALKSWVRYDKELTQALIAPMAFRALGKQAAPAIPELVRRMNDTNAPWAAERAISALANMGESATSALVTQMTDTNAPYRWKVASALPNFSCFRTNEQVVALLISNLGDKDRLVSFGVSEALARMALFREPAVARLVVPALTPCLNSEKPEHRARAFEAMVAYTEFNSEVIPILQNVAAKEPDALTKGYVEWLLRRHRIQVLTNAPQK